MTCHYRDEPLHHEQRDKERHDEAEPDRTEPHAMPARQFVPVLEELERGRAEHCRDREEEAELGRGAPLDAEGERAEDRRARAADARHHRQTLQAADPDYLAERDIGHADDVALGREPLDRDDRDPADDERDRHDQSISEQRLDLFVDREAQDCRWNERDEDVAHEAQRHRVAPRQPHRDRQERPPVEHDDRQDRTQLDDDVEHFPARRVVAEQLGREDEVSRRRHRQEFGHPLDDAEQDDVDDVAHEIPLKDCAYAAAGSANRPPLR